MIRISSADGFHERIPWQDRVLSALTLGEGCWEWSAGLDHYGYGRIKRFGRAEKAHRLAFELFTGHPVPADMSMDHLCGNKRYCRPDHLEIVTRGENASRGWQRGEYNIRKRVCLHYRSEWYWRPNGSGGYCRRCRRR